MSSLAAKALELGIPMQIEIDNELRYSYCDAHMADLASLEGKKYAIYKGECSCRHTYEIRREIQELQQSAQIVNGEIMYGNQKGFVADELEEF